MIDRDDCRARHELEHAAKRQPADPKNEDVAAQRLVQRVARNLDREAFAELFDAFAPRVKTFIIRKGASPDLAEDLVQETMINVWTKAGYYDPAKGSVLTWIFTIARNLRIDRIRRESSRPVSELGRFRSAIRRACERGNSCTQR